MTAPSRPEVSIVVPVTGAPAQVLRCLEGIAGLPEQPSFEVIVVDDASVGLEALLHRLDGDVEVVRSTRRAGLAGSLRLGLERARGNIAVLVRDAAAPGPGWLAPLAHVLADPSVGAVASATEGDPHPQAIGTWALALRTVDLRAAGVPDCPGELVLPAIALAVAQGGRRIPTEPASVIRAPGSRSVGARRAQAPGTPAELTVVIPTLDAASERVRSCVAAVQTSTEQSHQIVLVDNGSPPQGFSAPVNAGLRAAETPYVVVMNDDVEPLPGWWPPLREALDAGAPVAFPLTVDGAMRRDFAAWCFAMSREAIDRFAHAPGQFFDPRLVVWYQDTDLLHRLRRAGCPPVLVEASQIRHGLSETVASDDPQLSAWIRRQVQADREQFLAKHPDAEMNGHALAS